MKKGLKGKRILITSGPTSVAIDEMRVLTNRSTGEMGRLIANACLKKGGRVTLLEGSATTTIALQNGITRHKFFLFEELDRLLEKELKKNPDIVIHAAAVSDFRPKNIFKGKIPSHDKINIELVPVKKLIGRVRQLAPRSLLVGFKFESSLQLAIETSRSLFLESGCDLVVANAQKTKTYSARILCCDGRSRIILKTKAQVAQHLTDQISL